MKRCCATQIARLVQAEKDRNSANRRVTRLQNAIYDALLANRPPKFLEARLKQLSQQLMVLNDEVDRLEHFLDIRWHDAFERCYHGNLREA